MVLATFPIAIGCASPSSNTESLGTATSANTIEGTLCAAPRSGVEFCVSSNGNLNVAWNQAASAGGEPIQMWANWPSGISLGELVSDPSRMSAWLADVNKVLDFVRNNKSAESYKATMAGHLAVKLKQVKDEQARLLSQPELDPIGQFKKALIEKANAENAPIQAQIADDKQSIARVNEVFHRTKSALAPTKHAYASIMNRFKAYREGEEAEAANFASLAQQASNTTLATLPGIEAAILAAARAASTAPNDLLLDVMRLSAELQQIELQYRAGLAPLANFIASHGTSIPDMTGGAIRSLAAMEVYIQRRSARNDATANSLLDGVEVRRQALIALAASEEARATLAQTRLLAASTTFNDDATARIAELWRTPPMNTTLNLPYLSERYDRFTTFLQLEPLCNTDTAAWRETGCIALRRHFNTARTYLTNTIPMLVRMGVATMRTKGVDPTLLDGIQAKLTSGDVRATVAAYDGALRASEGT